MKPYTELISLAGRVARDDTAPAQVRDWGAKLHASMIDTGSSIPVSDMVWLQTLCDSYHHAIRELAGIMDPGKGRR